jgi:tRNA (guanine9-N1)-methyltransferase
MPTRKVLTVNQVRAVILVRLNKGTAHSQVFEILTKYLSLNDWRKAFEAVIPNRKYDELGKKALRRQQRRAKFTASNPSGDQIPDEMAGGSDEDDSDTDDDEYDQGMDDPGMGQEDARELPVDDRLPAAANCGQHLATASVDDELDEEKSMNS